MTAGGNAGDVFPGGGSSRSDEMRSESHPAVEACVDWTLERVGKSIRLGAPLGLGKANQLVNAFYRRAEADPDLDLTIFTALSLARPRWSDELERRFLEPLAQRLFAGFPELAYVDPLRKGRLPPNVKVREFYFQPGAHLGSPLAQQGHVSSNYTHVVRDLLDQGVNVLAQLVATEERGGEVRYSLGSNPDLTVDLVPGLLRRRQRGEGVALLAQVNAEMPFMYGDAQVGPDYFDRVVCEEALDFPLFGVPNQPVELRDHMIALHVSTLVRDGGTIQIGIGSLGDAITRALQLRHEENELYCDAVDAAGIRAKYGTMVERIGGLEQFEKGLYASSEMLVHGLLELWKSGLLRRRVYGSAPLQRLLNQGRIGEEVTWETVEAVLDEGTVPPSLDQGDVAYLKDFGILKGGVTWEDGCLILEDGESVPAHLHHERTREVLRERGLGKHLAGGHWAHACFFLGQRSFYHELRSLAPEDRRVLGMTGISFVNQLYGDEELKRLQRQHARFINTGMIVTLGGAVASDGLEDGRVVSGVGGQYNFVAMAHELEGGRSILMVPSTSARGGDVSSNIRARYGHVTIPRHLKDLVVTEYGIADLRGRSDGEVAAALIEIADARFQEQLVEAAKEAGKLDRRYSLPDSARGNTPEALEGKLSAHRERGLFQRFPFGTSLTEEELVLKEALSVLDAARKGEEFPIPGPREVKDVVTVPEAARPYLERLDLQDPSSASEQAMQRLVVFGLSSINAI